MYLCLMESVRCLLGYASCRLDDFFEFSLQLWGEILISSRHEHPRQFSVFGFARDLHYLQRISLNQSQPLNDIQLGMSLISRPVGGGPKSHIFSASLVRQKNGLQVSSQSSPITIEG